jgi:hypothetical protein
MPMEREPPDPGPPCRRWGRGVPGSRRDDGARGSGAADHLETRRDGVGGPDRDPAALLSPLAVQLAAGRQAPGCGPSSTSRTRVAFGSMATPWRPSRLRLYPSGSGSSPVVVMVTATKPVPGAIASSPLQPCQRSAATARASPRVAWECGWRGHIEASSQGRGTAKPRPGPGRAQHEDEPTIAPVL